MTHPFLWEFTSFFFLCASPPITVSVVITGIGPDFTSLKSFGEVDAFAENLVRASRLQNR